MQVKFYRNLSDERVISKTLDNESTLSNVKLLEATDILRPRLKIKSAANVLTVYNYMYIPDYRRYYYIDELTADNGFCYITAHCDVLMSHASELRNCDCVVARNQSRYNLYLNDDRFSALQYQKQQIIRFETPFKKSGEFVLVTQGG